MIDKGVLLFLPHHNFRAMLHNGEDGKANIKNLFKKDEPTSSSEDYWGELIAKEKNSVHEEVTTADLDADIRQAKKYLDGADKRYSNINRLYNDDIVGYAMYMTILAVATPEGTSGGEYSKYEAGEVCQRYGIDVEPDEGRTSFYKLTDPGNLVEVNWYANNEDNYTSTKKRDTNNENIDLIRKNMSFIKMKFHEQ